MRVWCAGAAVASAAVMPAAGVLAQAGAGGGAPAAAGGWTAPPTPWGTPDLSGIWNSKTRPVDNPEDLPGIERCTGLTSMPCIGGNCAMARIVQGPDSVSIYIEQGHGGGEYRTIYLDARPHPPTGVREGNYSLTSMLGGARQLEREQPARKK